LFKAADIKLEDLHEAEEPVENYDPDDPTTKLFEAALGQVSRKGQRRK